jgi:hypothetical protein
MSPQLGWLRLVTSIGYCTKLKVGPDGMHDPVQNRLLGGERHLISVFHSTTSTDAQRFTVFTLNLMSEGGPNPVRRNIHPFSSP